MGEIGEILYPEEFNTNRILTHPKFEEELKDIIERSGFKQRFVTLYRLRLKHLERYWERCTEKKDWFEILQNSQSLYSIRFNNKKKNIRVIFIFTSYQKRQIALLLYSFEEKDSKNNSKYSYNKASKVAHKRQDQVKHLLD